jgi:YidC/Oxa1 family membrane protein insertase
MDNRTLNAVFLTLIVYYVWAGLFVYGWFGIFPPRVEEPVDAEQALIEPTPGSGAVTPTQAAAPGQAVGEPSLSPVLERRSEDVPFELCEADALMSTEDGGLHTLALRTHTARYDVQPFYAWVMSGFAGSWEPYGHDPGPVMPLSGEARALVAGVGAGFAPMVEVVERSAGRLVTRGVIEGVEVVRTLQVVPGTPCRLEVEVRWHNQGSASWSRGLWFGMHDVLKEAASSYAMAVRPRAEVDGSVYDGDDLEALTQPEQVPGKVGWFGMADTYFATLLVPVPAGGSSAGQIELGQRVSKTGQALQGISYRVDAALAPGAVHVERFELYSGIKEMNQLRAYDERLSSAVELGFFAVLALPLLYLLQLVHGVTQDWALAIIGLTLLLKIAFFRLTQRSYESQQAMQKIQPDLKRIQEQYKDQPEELQKRMVELFRVNGVNPASGCLPMLVQMPVWFALYTVLLSSVELYHTEFLYLRDLTEPDPYMLLPTIVMALMVAQQRMMPTGNLDPAQEQMMKLMPLIFGVLFFLFPAGLALYVFVNMLLSILQQWYIKRTFKGVDPTPTVAGA